MNKRLPINAASLLMIYTLLCTPLVCAHTATIANSFILLLSLFCFYLLGAALLISVPVCKSFIPISHAAISIFIGGLLFSMAIFLSANTIFLIALLAFLTIFLLFFFRKNIDWSFNHGIGSIVCFITAIALIVLISDDLPSREFLARQPGTPSYFADYYYFTSIARSVRQGSIFSAAYEINSPINYQILGFFIPGLWANILNISSHQALWNLGGLFYKLLVMLLSYELFYFFLKEKVSRTNYGFNIVSMLLPILTAPLHPLYIIKGEVNNFIYNGWGFLVPSGTITYPTGMCMFLFSLLLFSSINWKNKKITADKIFFTLSLPLLLIAKVPLFYSFSLFIGAIVIKRIIYNKEKITNYLGYGVVFMVLSALLQKMCYSQSTGEKMYFKYGYMAELLGTWYHKTALSVPAVILLLLLTFLFCIGMRLIGFIAIKKIKDPLLNEFFLAALIALLGVTLVASFLHIEMIDSKGKFIEDSTANGVQFIRACFYIIAIISTIGILHLFYSKILKRGFAIALIVFTVAWCSFSFAALVSYHFRYDRSPEYPWYTDNLKQLESGKYNDGLIALNPLVPFCGIMLASSDYGKYWVSMDLSGINFNLTLRNSYRWDLYRNLLNKPEEKYFIQMKNEGVKYLISTEYDSVRMVEISRQFPAHMQKVTGSGWIYEIK